MEPLTVDDLIAVFRATVSPDYYAGIVGQANGQGLDPYHAAAAMLARAADAVNTTIEAYFILPSSWQTAPPGAGAAYATGAVQVTRSGSVSFDLVIPRGTLFVEDQLGPDGVTRDGAIFASTEDVTMAAGSTAPVSVPVRCTRVGYQGNVPAEQIARFVTLGTATVPVASIASNVITDTGVPDRFSRAMVGRYVLIEGGANAGVYAQIAEVNPGGTAGTDTATVTGPTLTDGSAVAALVLEWGDLGLTVTQPAAMTGGTHAWLDVAANERRLGRQLSESDDALRYRIVQVQDVVTPGAINRIAARALTPLGVPWKIVETRGVLRGFVLDHDAMDTGDVCNDGAVLVSEAQSVRFFVICVGIGTMLGDFGFFMDATDLPGGMVNALDAEVPLGNFLDGYPVPYYTAVSVLWQTVNQARADGVAFEIHPDADL